jgi:hypothetical protein
MAIRESVLIAKKRGEVRQFMHEPDMICNFVIYCLGFVAHVRIKRVTRVHCSHTWIEREAADALASLRAIASAPGISRELWVFLPRGSFRFFRVEDTGLIELSRDGSVMPEKPKPGIPAQSTIPVEETPARGVPAGPGPVPLVQAPPPGVSVGEDPPGKGGGG